MSTFLKLCIKYEELKVTSNNIVISVLKLKFNDHLKLNLTIHVKKYFWFWIVDININIKDKIIKVFHNLITGIFNMYNKKIYVIDILINKSVLLKHI